MPVERLGHRDEPRCLALRKGSLHGDEVEREAIIIVKSDPMTMVKTTMRRVSEAHDVTSPAMMTPSVHPRMPENSRASHPRRAPSRCPPRNVTRSAPRNPRTIQIGIATEFTDRDHERAPPTVAADGLDDA